MLIARTQTIIFSVPPDLGRALAAFLCTLGLLARVARAQARWSGRARCVGGALFVGAIALLIVLSLG